MFGYEQSIWHYARFCVDRMGGHGGGGGAADLSKLAAFMTRPFREKTLMTPRIPESIFTWYSLINTTMPPRDPNDNDDEEEEEDEDDEDEEDENRQPAVIREPDEDE